MSGKMITGHVADFSSQNIALIILGIEATVSIRARIMEKLKVPTAAFYKYVLLASIICRRSSDEDHNY